MAKEVPQSVKFSLKAVLLSCEKSRGIKQTAVEKDFFKLNNYNLDFGKYGFRDLYEFLLAVPDVARLQYSPKDGENRVFGVGGQGVYMSAHAKKAEGIPNGLNPLPPSEWPRNKAKVGASVKRTVAETQSSLKVTVPSDSRKKILPNAQGLFGLHIKNVPSDCLENDLKSIFKKYESLAEVKIEKLHSKRVAFVRFSKAEDAFKALDEMDGFNFKGNSLIVNPAVQESAKGGKKPMELAKKKKENRTTLKKENVELASGKNETTALTLNKQTSIPAENWEKEGGLSKAAGSQDELESYVVESLGGYPIHVSNFPAGTGQSTLKQLFSGCGEIIQVHANEKFAFIYFSKREEAITALRSMQKRIQMRGQYLTVTPKYSKGRCKQHSDLTGASRVVQSSGESSLSSGSVTSIPQVVNQSITHSGEFGSQKSHDCHTNTRSHEIDTHAYKDLDERFTKQVNILNTSSGTCTLQEENKLNQQNLKVETLDTGGCIARSVSEKSEQKVPIHSLLTQQEISILMSKCKKPIRTASSIAFEEFNILITDVIDSCHFWANIDDKSDSYKRLKKIQGELQTVNKNVGCIPVKHQLGAALFSEDTQWYRCWCLEASVPEKREAKVFFVDYGNFEWISWDNFVEIAPNFWDLAPQALPFKLAGLKNAANLALDFQTEGSKYLRDLICNKVCWARKVKSSDPNKPHIIEVELVLDDSSINQQMAKTRYVHQTTTGTQETIQSPAVQTSIQPQSLRSKSAERHIPPHPFMKTQTAHEAHSTKPYMEQPTNSPLDVTRNLLDGTQPQSTQSPFQGEKTKLDQQTPQNAKFDPGRELPKEVFQHQQTLPNQLFEKKEVTDVILSNVVSPDNLSFFLARGKARQLLATIKSILGDAVDAKAEGGKIYPRKGDVVVKAHNTKKFRVEIIDIPGNAGHGIDQVKVKDIDYGNVEMAPLKTLYELPASIKNIPPQANHAKLAGIRKKQGMNIYSEGATQLLDDARRRRQAMKASVVKREPNGPLHVELFESSLSCPSLNVQLVKMGFAEIDPLQCNLSRSDFSCLCPVDGKSLNPQRLNNNQFSSAGQQPSLIKRKLESHQWETLSVHSDWEDNLIEIKDRNDLSPAGSHSELSGRQSREQLYVPPPPDSNFELFSPSRSNNTELSAPTGAISRLYQDASLSSRSSISEPCEFELPRSANLASDTNRDAYPIAPAEGEYSVLRNLARPPSPSATSSDTSGIYSDASVNSLSSTESVMNIESLPQQNVLAPQQYVDDISTRQDWRKQREELVQRDEELQRILEMPRKEMKKMLSLRQEKEKLERKIRIKGLENHILKLQKELKQLETEKKDLESKCKL